MDFDAEKFEQEWSKLALTICQAIYHNPEIQKLKEHLARPGFLSFEDKSQFINLADRIKYQLIYQKYGGEGSAGYKKFSQDWQQWFQTKGVESQKQHGERGCVEHILFGSTPDPEKFLADFEAEKLRLSKKTSAY